MMIARRKVFGWLRKVHWVELALVFGFFLAGSIPVIVYGFGQAEAVADEAPDYSQVAPDIDARIKETQIDPLKKESLKQSLTHLYDIEMYYWPGSPPENGGTMTPTLPLPTDRDGRRASRQIMSNRRFLKVMMQLSALGKEKASALVRDEIKKTLPKYRGEYAKSKKTFDKYLKPLKPGQPVLGVCWNQRNNADGSPTFPGLRFKLFALFLIAGNLELRETKPLVMEAASEAIEQYQDLCRKDRYNEFTAWQFVMEASLYNRQILATAVLGVSEKAQSAAKLGYKTMDLPAYDAQATPYDLHGRIGVVPVNLSKGMITVRYLESVSDAALRDMVKAARE